MILGTGSVSWFEMQNLSCSCLQTTSPLSSPIRTLTSTHQPPLRWLCPALTVPPRAFPAPDPFSACALSLRIHLLPYSLISVSITAFPTVSLPSCTYLHAGLCPLALLKMGAILLCYSHSCLPIASTVPGPCQRTYQ